MDEGKKIDDVAIVGAGVTGAALLYVLAKYTDIGRIVLIETNTGPAEVSSHAAHNSQTLHFGDIETNYSVDKARSVKAAAEMVVKYVEGLADADRIMAKMQKMVLGVGEDEVRTLRDRFEEFRALFPEVRLVRREELARLEPKVVEGRDPHEPIIAIYNERGFVIDFGRLAQSFIDEARRIGGVRVEVVYGARVRQIRRENGAFALATEKTTRRANAVVVAAGAHSLHFAHALGYGKEYTLLPLAGDFFVAPNLLHGKVYTVQKKQLPFAAVHADPDFVRPELMRFGPVARAVPVLEPGRWRTVFDFFKVFRPDPATLATIYTVNADRVVLGFITRHLLYYLPVIGKYFFLAEGRKIIPTLSPQRLVLDRARGGVRPQVANKKTRQLQMGDAKIIGEGVIFNVTPSPGASVCLKNAVDDARTLIGFFGERFRIDETALRRDLI